MGDDKLVVYKARRIRTMEPSLPIADAIAVRGGRIVEVGSLQTMGPWLDRSEHSIDETFRDHVLFPGFIDPHLHPAMAAILLPMEFTTSVDWHLPWGSTGRVTDRQGLLDRLSALDQSREPDEPLFAWGHHPIWHGDIDRLTLDDISSSRPIIVWHRGYHSLVINSAGLEWLGVDTKEAAEHPQVDLDRGAFFETGLSFAYRYLNPFLLGTDRFRAGLDRMRQVIHHGGQTTIGDAAVGLFDFELEWQHINAVMEQPSTPFRIMCIPWPLGPEGDETTDAEMLERVIGYRERNTHRMFFSDHVKMFADGGFFAELLQLQAPGHLDGREGEWVTPPERFEELARLFWNAGLRIHVHCSGDAGIAFVLDTLEKLQWEHPRFDHRFTLEHFGISTPQQVRKLKELGGLVSANAYYVYELSQAFAENAVGYERASQMTRLGSLERAGIPFAVHSDFTMAPAQPLNNAWVAANRINAAGNLMGPSERTTLDAALSAITSNAALVLGLENEIGTLRWGKKADFTVLEEDPYDVGVEGLKDIPVWGTVFEGELFPI